MTGPYEGVHGFLFLHDEDETPPEEVIEGLSKLVDRENGPVFFASLFDGAFAGFVHYAADDLPALGRFVNNELFELGRPLRQFDRGRRPHRRHDDPWVRNDTVHASAGSAGSARPRSP